MLKVIKDATGMLHRFIREEEGAQVVEYALVIALVSIALALALGNATTGVPSAFSDLVTRLKACLDSSTTTTC